MQRTVSRNHCEINATRNPDRGGNRKADGCRSGTRRWLDPPRTLPLCLCGGLRPEQEAAKMTWKASRTAMSSWRARSPKPPVMLGTSRSILSLRAWLHLGGDLPVKGLQGRLRRVRELAGIPWSPDCMWHSLVSYSVPTGEPCVWPNGQGTRRWSCTSLTGKPCLSRRRTGFGQSCHSCKPRSKRTP